MKIICNKSALLTGVNTVLKAVPARTTMPILECILIDTTSGVIKKRGVHIHKYIYDNVVVVVGGVYIVDKLYNRDKC